MLNLDDGNGVKVFAKIGYCRADAEGRVRLEALPGNMALSVDAAAFVIEEEAPFALVDDFQTYEVGSSIVGQGGWAGFYPRGSRMTSSIVMDDTLFGQKVLSVTNCSNGGVFVNLGENAIHREPLCTAFFRYRTFGSSACYLSHSASVNSGDWYVISDDAGIYNHYTCTGRVCPHWDMRSHYIEIENGKWYNVWIVADFIGQVFTMHLSQGEDSGVGDETSGAACGTYRFRISGDCFDFPLFFLAGSGNEGGHIDDLYIAKGVNFSIPSKAGKAVYFKGSLFILR